MVFLAKRCGKDIGVAAVGKFQPFAQLCYRKWEVPNGDIGFGESADDMFQFFLVHRGDLLNLEFAPREVRNELRRKEKMTVAASWLHPKAVGHFGKASGFHDRGIGFVKEIPLPQDGEKWSGKAVV